MARYSQERDDQSRFMSDDDCSYASRSCSGYRGRGGYDNDDYSRYRQGRNQGQGWFGNSEGHAEAGPYGHGDYSPNMRGSYEDERHNGPHAYSRTRDDQGRFMGDDDRYSQRNHGNYRGRSEYDDSNSRLRDYGQSYGSWFGGPEGHAEAPRQRSYGQGMSNGRRTQYDEDDEDGYSSSLRYGRGQGHGSEFRDAENQSEAGRQRSR